MLDVAARPAPDMNRNGARDHDDAADTAGDDDGSGQSDQPPPHAAHDPASGSPTLTLFGFDEIPSLDVAWIQRSLCRALEALNLQSGSVRIRVVEDAEMADLHRRYSGLNSTTDVLTFDLLDHDSDEEDVPVDDKGDPLVVDVDIVVCVDEARRQAATRSHDVEAELVLYGLHGMLHCLGYDDHEEDEYVAMHAREDEILKAIGIGAVFRGEHRETEDSDSQSHAAEPEA